jgi:hypothetical protein
MIKEIDDKIWKQCCKKHPLNSFKWNDEAIEAYKKYKQQDYSNAKIFPLNPTKKSFKRNVIHVRRMKMYINTMFWQSFNVK